MKKRTTVSKKPARRASTAPPSPSASGLFDRVAAILDAARTGIVRAVNTRMVLAYWLIGREIVQELQGGDERAEYGKQVLGDLSKRLTEKYGDGYSATNLKYFRIFYSTFADREPAIRHALRDQSGPEARPSSRPESKEGPIRHSPRDESAISPVPLAIGEEPAVSPAAGGTHQVLPDKPPFHPSLSWTHYRALAQVEKPQAREFYEAECAASGWSTRELERQIHSFYYERLLASKDRKGMLIGQRQSLPASDPAEMLKSSTVLEFLGLPDTPRLHESALEQAIMDNLQTFLLEMGRGFSFVARQKLLRYEDDEFYVDLVFYNFLLKCFVLIDLKIGKLTHQDVGQMDSYVRLYEDLFKVEGDNPTVGLILCSQKNETIARYSVLKESKQLFASKYRLHLPSEEELAAELKREIQLIEEGRE